MLGKSKKKTVRPSVMVDVEIMGIVNSGSGYGIMLANTPMDHNSKIMAVHVDLIVASYLEFALRGKPEERPLTHTLIKNILDKFSMDVTEVVINDLKDGIFFAELHIVKKIMKEGASEPDIVDYYMLDCRPSDAINIAARYGCPIRVRQEVWDECAKTPEELGMSGSKSSENL